MVRGKSRLVRSGNMGPLWTHGYEIKSINRNTRAGTKKKFKTIKYENAKYRDSPYYKASKLWDTLPQEITNIASLYELKKLLKTHFSPFDELYFLS